MKEYLVTAARVLIEYCRAFIIIAFMLYIGNMLSSILPFMVPGSVIGLLLLFFLLVFQIIPVNWVNVGCNILIRYMTLLFVPAIMGIMQSYPYLLSDFLPLTLSVLGSSIIILVYVGTVCQYLQNKSVEEKP